MAENKEIGFWKLIQDYSIVIPIIQRDYAQGRDSPKTKKIRTKFLNDLISAIENKQALELDFVYGSVENVVLQPLDGQQRLTTLYLLHWYIALKTGKLTETKNEFHKFTYETRISSREFCNGLVNNGENLGEGKTISEKITDSNWFFLSWKKDPTIKAMLLMLDCIEAVLSGKEEKLVNFWQTLTSETENPPITFHFKELSDIGLTDDLYIKMNARGKALTEFENFKARFEKHIENNKWEENVTTPAETFSHKIDTIWTDLFWKHRGADNQIDNEFVKFIAGLAVNYYAENLEIYKDDTEQENVKERTLGKLVTDDAINRERVERRLADLFNNPTDINPNDFSTKGSFEYLKKCLDIYYMRDELLPSNLSLWNFCEDLKVKINNNNEIDNNLFIEFIKEKLTTYPQRVLFYAQTEYLLNTATFNAESFSEWMRVARNIVVNATINNASAFIGAIGLINELSKGCENIYKYLNENNVKSVFAKDQVKEELLKSSIIAKDINYKTVIFLTEDTNFCRGRIEFALYCIDFINTEDVFDSSALLKVKNVIGEYLSENDISNEFRRGLLTIGDNCFYKYWDSWLYAANAPKYCLIEGISDFKNIAYGITKRNDKEFKKYLKDLINQLTSKNLNDIIAEYNLPEDMQNWKKRFIREKDLLDKSQNHYFAIGLDKCWLIPSTKVENSADGLKKCEMVE